MTVIGPPEGMAFILAKLQADSTLTALLPQGANSIFRKVAPQAAVNTPPYVLMSYQGGADTMGSFADRLFTSGLYQVVAVGPDTQMATLISIARQIDADLHKPAVYTATQGAVILASYREQPLELSEVLSGTDQLWTRVGGLYRLLVQ